MGDMSKNLSRSEFACHCGCGEDDISPELVAGLQELHDLAERTIHILSGCRCLAHNRACGGEPHSFHVPLSTRPGYAADVYFEPPLSVQKMYALARKVPAFYRGGIGLYPEANPPFMHVDVREAEARWAKVGGRYVGIDEALA